MSDESHALQVRVGVFMAFGIAMAAVAILALGRNSGLFERKTTLYAYFPDVSGLVSGAPVRLAGLDVGTVSDIELGGPAGQARVTLSIKSRYATRLKKDSVVVIDSKGLLGDKLLNIGTGSPRAAPVADGDILASRPAPSFEQLAGKLEAAISSITKVSDSAGQALEQLTSPGGRRDIGRIASSIAALLERVESGPGTLHRVFFDARYADELERLFGSARAALSAAGDAARRIDRTLAAVESSRGLAHELLYGQSGRSTIAALRNAANEIADISAQVRDGDGLLHALIFEPERKRALDDLGAAAARINAITAQIEAGRGTLGGLVVDPTVYEDLSAVLGNIKRNVLLKAIIRFTIKRGDIQRPASVPVREVNRQ